MLVKVLCILIIALLLSSLFQTKILESSIKKYQNNFWKLHILNQKLPLKLYSILKKKAKKYGETRFPKYHSVISLMNFLGSFSERGC